MLVKKRLKAYGTLGVAGRVKRFFGTLASLKRWNRRLEEIADSVETVTNVVLR